MGDSAFDQHVKKDHLSPAELGYVVRTIQTEVPSCEGWNSLFAGKEVWGPELEDSPAPVAKPQKDSTPKMVTLICQARTVDCRADDEGKWQRKSQRGRKPHHCPECKQHMEEQQ